MESFTIELPSEHDQEIARRFTVTYHYLLALRFYLDNAYGRGRDLERGIGSALASHPPYLKLQRKPGLASADTVRRHLEIAWVGEIALRLPGTIGSNNAFRYSNAWAPIHAYYAAYMLLQAWFDVNGMVGLADDHTATLRSISNQIVDRRLFPPPWSVAARGNVLGGDCTFINEPIAGACAAKVQVLSRPIGLPGAYSDADFWARFGTWLRTTREARLGVKEDEWKRKHGRKRIDSTVRAQYASSLHATSLFDCLWRLRIRSNYRSVETYLARFVGDQDAAQFHKATVRITRANLFLLECYVARMVGPRQFDEIVETFLKQDGGVAQQTVGRRQPLVIATATS